MEKCNCDICGVSSDKKYVAFRKKYQKFLCDKHCAQIKSYGHIIDATPRGCFDLNDYTIKDGIVYMELYDRRNNVVAITKFDQEFLPVLSQRKWRPVKKRNKLYVMTIGRKEEGVSHIAMHQIIGRMIGLVSNHSLEIDHIDGDSLNNCTNNLRNLTRAEQMLNICCTYNSSIPIRGVSYDKRNNNFVVEIKVGHVRYYCKRFNTIEEAACARYYLEKHLIAEYYIERSEKLLKPYMDKLDDKTKHDIELYVLGIISRYGKGDSKAS